MFPSAANWDNSWKRARYNTADIETRPAGRYETEHSPQNVREAKQSETTEESGTRIKRWNNAHTHAEKMNLSQVKTSSYHRQTARTA